MAQAQRKLSLNAFTPMQRLSVCCHRNCSVRSLQFERRRCIGQSYMLSEHEVICTERPADDIDAAAQALTQGVALLLRTKKQKKLKSIELALAKIEAGSFGLCESCAEPIDRKRLEAMPDALFCITCQKEEEEENQKCS